MTQELPVGQGTKVTLHFSLALEDGSVVDSNFGGQPAEFEFGDGSLLPGFEQSIIGLVPGDQRSLTIAPEDSFGRPNPDNVQEVARKQFPKDIELEKGLVLSFADAQNAERPGVVLSFDEGQVTVDFNHPLAGRTITFDVQILDVNPVVTH